MTPTGPSTAASLEIGGSASAGKIIGKDEMARRVRAHDWATTSLGPIHHWSPELVAVVNFVLSLPTPARLLWGPQLVLIYNDGYCSIPGRRHPDALGRPAREVFHESWQVIGRVLETAFVTGEPFVFDKRRVPVDTGQGTKELWLDCTYSPVYENGAVAGLLGLFHDVTSEVDTACDLQIRLNALRDTCLNPIALLTPDGLLVDCNSGWLSPAGHCREELIGKHIAQASPWAPTPGLPDLLRRAIQTASTGQTFHADLPLERPNQDSQIYEFSLSPVRDDYGAITYLVAEAREITEEKRIQSALFKSEKLAAVGRLASSIAHEINNPLESVMNLIYLARNAAPADVTKFLDLADQEIRRVSLIANQTLRFHKQSAKAQPASAADLFSTVMSIYEGRLRNAHIRVEKRFRAGQPVACFAGDIRQVLNNLVANATEAMPLGGRLLIRSRASRDWKTGRAGLVLTIADNGSGIPPEAKQRIFDAFFTTKGAAGNGLGLWVCQEIVERHRGRLKVRSSQRPGRNGTAFTLFLPLDASSQSAG